MNRLPQFCMLTAVANSANRWNKNGKQKLECAFMKPYLRHISAIGSLFPLLYFSFLCMRDTMLHTVFMLVFRGATIPQYLLPFIIPSPFYCQALKAIAHMLLEEGVIQR